MTTSFLGMNNSFKGEYILLRGKVHKHMQVLLLPRRKTKEILLCSSFSKVFAGFWKGFPAESPLYPEESIGKMLYLKIDTRRVRWKRRKRFLRHFKLMLSSEWLKPAKLLYVIEYAGNKTRHFAMLLVRYLGSHIFSNGDFFIDSPAMNTRFSILMFWP